MQLSINYIASLPSSSFFLDITHTYHDLTSTTIYSSSLNTVRSTTLNLNYKLKTNSSNAVCVYTTTGLSIMRKSNTFQYHLQILERGTYFATANLTLQHHNGMRFIRVAIFNY